MRRDYDVVIAGASFAGLAVASRVRGDVLIVDRAIPGTEQRSACGTFLSVPRTLGLEHAVVDVRERAVIHAPGVSTFDLEDPLCTLDYEKFCRGFLEQSRATVANVAATGVERVSDGVLMHTPQGRFHARVVVDASGWRASVSRSLAGRPLDFSGLSYALETSAPYVADRFYFWWGDPRKRDVGWLFPARSESRIGLGSYRGAVVGAGDVHAFAGPFNGEGGRIHGGFIPNRLGDPVLGGAFVVGDAAGQCLPLTAEGIRPAIFFGQRCGDLVDDVIDGRLALPEALATYRRLVHGRRHWYRTLDLLQRGLPHVPAPLMARILRLLEERSWSRTFLARYMRMMPLEAPLASSGVPGGGLVRAEAGEGR